MLANILFGDSHTEDLGVAFFYLYNSKFQIIGMAYNFVFQDSEKGTMPEL
jgi:hypothetical protein